MGERVYRSTFRWRRHWLKCVVSFTPRPLYPGERAPGTHWKGGWLDPRIGLNDVENKMYVVQPVTQSLYRLHYPGSPLVFIKYAYEYYFTKNSRINY
jgi:hypothetical protein